MSLAALKAHASEHGVKHTSPKRPVGVLPGAWGMKHLAFITQVRDFGRAYSLSTRLPLLISKHWWKLEFNFMKLSQQLENIPEFLRRVTTHTSLSQQSGNAGILRHVTTHANLSYNDNR